MVPTPSSNCWSSPVCVQLVSIWSFEGYIQDINCSVILSIAIQRGNSASVMETMTSDEEYVV